MTDLEWKKYVERVAKTVKVPEWGMFYTPKSIVKRSDAIVREFERIEPEPEDVIIEKTKYVTKTYKYRGKIYKKKFLNKYDKIVTKPKIKKELTNRDEECKVVDMFVARFKEKENG